MRNGPMVWKSAILPAMLFLMFLATGCGLKPVLVVDASGNGDFKSLRNGLREWREGQEIEVRPGVYDEQIILKPKLVMRGTHRDKVVVRFTGVGPTVAGGDSSSVRISGMTFEKVNNIKHAVVQLRSADVEIDNCVIRGSAGAGISAEHYGHLLLKNSVVEKNGYGIHMIDHARGHFEGSEIRENKIGIQVMKFRDAVPRQQTVYRDEEEFDVTITKNKIEKNSQAGLILHKGSKTNVLENIITENGLLSEEEKGDRMMDPENGGVLVKDRSRANLTGNKIQNNFRGVDFQDGDGRMTDNQVVGNQTIGIRLTKNALPMVDNNTVKENGSGIQLRDANDSTVAANLVLENKYNGIEILSKSRGQIELNRVLKNGQAGIYVKEFGKPNIEKNIIAENGLAGIWAWKNAFPVIKNNTLWRNLKVGIRLKEKTDAQIVNNAIVLSPVGISITDNGVFPRVFNNLLWEIEGNKYQGFVENPRADVYGDPLFRDPARLDFSPLPNSALFPTREEQDLIGAAEPDSVSGS